MRYLRLMAVLFALGLTTLSARAESPVVLHGSGTMNISPAGSGTFALAGTATHLGNYQCYGEWQLAPGAVQGSKAGAGIAVFKAANGDLLVGVMSCELMPAGIGNMAFHWRDSVQFSNGAIVHSTGRFAHNRPPGATTLFRYQYGPNGIIAILIGL